MLLYRCVGHLNLPVLMKYLMLYRDLMRLDKKQQRRNPNHRMECTCTEILHARANRSFYLEKNDKNLSVIKLTITASRLIQWSVTNVHKSKKFLW